MLELAQIDWSVYLCKFLTCIGQNQHHPSGCFRSISFSVSVSQFESSDIFSNSTLTNSRHYLILHLRVYKHWQSSEYKFTHNKMKTIIHWWKWEISKEIKKKKKSQKITKIFNKSSVPFSRSMYNWSMKSSSEARSSSGKSIASQFWHQTLIELIQNKKKKGIEKLCSLKYCAM